MAIHNFYACLKWFYPPVVFLGTVCITEMAEVVVPAQVLKQLIIIKVTVIAELAERVPSVAGVIWVSVCSVTCQFLTVVPLPLVGEDLVGEVKLKDQVSNSKNNFLPWCCSPVAKDC